MNQQDILAVIGEATDHRGWISNSYAQIEFLLGDLIIRARAFPEYEKQTVTFTHSAVKRVKKVRAMLEIAGPLSPFAAELGNILDGFEDNHDVRNLLAHGFCEFHFTPTGDAGLVFRKFERGDVAQGHDADVLIERTFRLVDMHYHRTQFVAQAERALEVFAKVHFALGWGDLNPDTLDNDGWFQTNP